MWLVGFQHLEQIPTGVHPTSDLGHAECAPAAARSSPPGESHRPSFLEQFTPSVEGVVRQPRSLQNCFRDVPLRCSAAIRSAHSSSGWPAGPSGRAVQETLTVTTVTPGEIEREAKAEAKRETTYRTAIDDYTRAIQIDPGLVAAYVAGPTKSNLCY